MKKVYIHIEGAGQVLGPLERKDMHLESNDYISQQWE
jgi:hypothetical protein